MMDSGPFRRSAWHPARGGVGWWLMILLIHLASSFSPSTPWGRPVVMESPVRSLTLSPLSGIKGFRGWYESQFPSAIVGFDKRGSHENFDHVLIDVNQILHTTLRKSQSENHGLVLLIKELDACVNMATPTKSLVLAMDGPPGAAKLSTQRQRRKAVIVRSATKIKRLERIIAAGKRKVSKSVLARQKRKASGDLRTLAITPGTAFMERAAQAILYWTWQRMSNPTSPLHRVQVFLSTSQVPGEGEVKLLEWVYTKRRKDESIAFMGGDSDLVLEGLIIPPTSTHDIFVLLPDGPKRYLAVSLWETTRALQEHHIKHMHMSNVMRIRTDLVVIFILNGNDYLPKLRGSSGFSHLFQTYIRIQNDWNEMGRAQEAYLVEPDTLALNHEFCFDFFSTVAETSPSVEEMENRSVDPGSGITPLLKLYSLVDSGVLPKPVKFTVVEGGTDDESLISNSFEEIGTRELDSDTDAEEDYMDVDLLEDGDESDDQQLLRLSLGTMGTRDSYTYELWWPNNQRPRAGQHKLAEMALSDILGGTSSPLEDFDNDVEESMDKYDWELRTAAESDTSLYISGLLWNLNTYQDGICADYAYNYGRRKSPTAKDIASFCEEALTIGRPCLSPTKFTPPVNAGLSCLAALPSSMRELVPEPYCRISEAAIEDIYGKCMDPTDNGFNIVLFKELCENELRSLAVDENATVASTAWAPYTSNSTWTVLSRTRKPLAHPYEPPAPFDGRFSKLRRDRWIRISNIPAIAEPRVRNKRDHLGARRQKSRRGAAASLPPIRHSSPGREFLKLSIEKVPHRSIYLGSKVKGPEEEQKGFSVPPSLCTKDGVSAMSCLKQLEDAGFLAKIEWEEAHISRNGEKLSLKVHSLPPLHHFALSRDRKLNGKSRKQLKQQMASIAMESLLTECCNKKWQECSFDEIKRMILGRLRDR